VATLRRWQERRSRFSSRAARSGGPDSPRTTRATRRSASAGSTADGSWTALDEVEDGIVPADLAAALAARPPAAAGWESFSPSVRKGILQWIASAKRPGTRAKRIAETAELASRGLKANQWPRRR